MNKTNFNLQMVRLREENERQQKLIKELEEELQSKEES